MRKVMVSQMVTLDGFFSGPNGEIDWHVVDNEFNLFAIDQLNSVDLLLFGRITYQLMASYWPTPNAINDDPIVAGKMNSLQKIVFSKSLDKADWQNTRLVSDHMEQEIADLKRLPGKDMVIFGSGTIVSALTNADLIDEYRILINPVFLGSGKPLIQTLQGRLDLTLMRTKELPSGVVILYYAPKRKNIL